MKKLAKGIYVETRYRYLNVAAIETREGFILIDTPPHPEDAQDWAQALRDIADIPFLFIINTDHHRDRSLGHQWFGNARVIAHRAAADKMLTRDQNFVSVSAEQMALDDNELVQFASLKLVPPTVSYDETMQIVRGGQSVTLEHHPGPTAGSTWLEFPEQQILFVGDHIVTNTHPYLIDTQSGLWLDALNFLRRTPRYKDYAIVPGRGSITDVEASKPVSDYVATARRKVRSVFRAGRPRADTLEAVKEMLPLFPVRVTERKEIERRIRSGLERIFDEMKAGNEE